MAHFKPEDNPLRHVKVHISTEFDPERVAYRLLHGTDEGYKKPVRIESSENRQKREQKYEF